MEYRLFEEKDIDYIRFHIEDDDMKYNKTKIKKFIDDPNTLGFVARDNDEIIGFAYGHKILHPDGKVAFFLYSIGINDEYQDKGYGSKLLQFIKEYVKKLGCFEMFVMTDKGNPRACHVYEKIGCKSDSDYPEICYVVNLEKNNS